MGDFDCDCDCGSCGCGSCECGSCDCGSCDCGSFDCGLCDCGTTGGCELCGCETCDVEQCFFDACLCNLGCCSGEHISPSEAHNCVRDLFCCICECWAETQTSSTGPAVYYNSNGNNSIVRNPLHEVVNPETIVVDSQPSAILPTE